MIDTKYLSFSDNVIDALKALTTHSVEQINEKSPLDFVTNIDLEINKVVTNIIQSHFPNDKIISEETWDGIVEVKGAKIWVIDPLDGTSNCLSGLPYFACSIARIVDDKVDYGLVIDFIHDEVFSAQSGRGAFLNNKTIIPIKSSASFLGISTGFLKKASGKLGNLTEVVKFRLLGAQSLHLCYVACGRLRGAVNLESKIWDDIAGALIVRESGGYYTSLLNADLGKIGDWAKDGNVSGLALADINDSLQNEIRLCLD